MQQLTKEQAETLKELISVLSPGIKVNASEVFDILDEYTECTEETFLQEGSTVEDIINLKCALDEHINWDLTPQGHSYWDTVYEDLQGLIDELDDSPGDSGCTDSDCFCRD